MSLKDTVRDRLIGPQEGPQRQYHCDTCQTSFQSSHDPEVAACPGCGAHRVREA